MKKKTQQGIQYYNVRSVHVIISEPFIVDYAI